MADITAGLVKVRSGSGSGQVRSGQVRNGQKQGFDRGQRCFDRGQKCFDRGQSLTAVKDVLTVLTAVKV